VGASVKSGPHLGLAISRKCSGDVAVAARHCCRGPTLPGLARGERWQGEEVGTRGGDSPGVL